MMQPDVSFLIDASNGNELLLPEMQSRLVALNTLIGSLGVPLEGNLFYHHHAPKIASQTLPDPRRAQKRRNFWRAVMSKSHMLEIGFNGGHSALLAMSCNSTLRYTAIDIGRHPYVQPCADYLKQQFGDRFELFTGDSRDVMPGLAVFSDDRYDLVHVDGGHGAKNCVADMANALALPRARQVRQLLLDDTNQPQIIEIYRRFVDRGRLAADTKSGQWEGQESILSHIIE